MKKEYTIQIEGDLCATSWNGFNLYGELRENTKKLFTRTIFRGWINLLPRVHVCWFSCGRKNQHNSKLEVTMLKSSLIAAAILVAGLTPALADNPPRNAFCKVLDVHAGTVADHFLCDNTWYGLSKAMPVTADGLAYAQGFSTTPIVGYVPNDSFSVVLVAWSQGRSVSLITGASDIPCNTTVCGAALVPRVITVTTDASGSF